MTRSDGGTALYTSNTRPIHEKLNIHTEKTEIFDKAKTATRVLE